jgi:hypothetical protein
MYGAQNLVGRICAGDVHSVWGGSRSDICA